MTGQGGAATKPPLTLGILERAVRRPDAVALIALLMITAAAWLYLIGAPGMAGPMSGMDMSGMDMAGLALESWTLRDGLLLFVMWAVMMGAMMLPAAAPVILLFSRMMSERVAHGRQHTPVAIFATGYLLVWWVFSAAAALAQFGLHSVAALSPDMRLVSPVAAGVILIAAGIYQWLPIKHGCLDHCRSPLGFLTASWREGRAGALRMGITHGTFCLGCCWMIMVLLFVAGVMNLAWVALLSVVVLLEKVSPAGPTIARVAGLVMVVAGVASLYQAV